jgi:hypothetical protein
MKRKKKENVATTIPREIQEVIEHVTALFERKNRTYAGEQWFSNFTTAPPVVMGLMCPMEYAATLCAKQDTAVWQTIADPSTPRLCELPERLMDGIVYRIIMLAFHNITNPTEG